MFAWVISRENGEPWPPLGLTSASWLRRPVRLFNIDELVATQPGVLFEALMREGTPYGGDPLPHVVVWQGINYLEDGHHRVVRALLAGERTIEARYASPR